MVDEVFIVAVDVWICSVKDTCKTWILSISVYLDTNENILYRKVISFDITFCYTT